MEVHDEIDVGGSENVCRFVMELKKKMEMFEETTHLKHISFPFLQKF